MIEYFGVAGWTFHAYAYAYFTRLNEKLESKVIQNLERMKLNEHDVQKTISMPLRRSDKCRGHDIKGSAAGETYCPEVIFFSFISFKAHIGIKLV